MARYVFVWCHSSSGILHCSCTILVAAVSRRLSTTCTCTTKPVNNGSQRRLFLRRSITIDAQCSTAKVSCAVALLPTKYFASSSSSTKSSCRDCRSSATCSTVVCGLPSSRFSPIVRFQELLRTEVCSIANLLLVRNAAGRAYILGGHICQDARASNNCTFNLSVEMLDMSLGKWQTSPVSLRGVAKYFQIAMLDHQLGASRRTDDTVNEMTFQENATIRPQQPHRRTRLHRTRRR